MYSILPAGGHGHSGTIDITAYDHIIVAFSGGKDSLACLLHLIDIGAPRDRIELWHHDVDGREGSTLMDWPVTRDYCRQIARAFNLPIYFSWKVGGFEGEMLRQDSPTAATAFEDAAGTVRTVGGKSGKRSTRRQFPQVSADLQVRWCSAYLKIDVGAIALNNQDRFLNRRTLFITGERGEESTARAEYAPFEPHRTDRRNGKRKRRHVDHWRPVLNWPERQVWQIIQRHRVAPHPVYDAGFSRVSCANCIFSSANQLATLERHRPESVGRVAHFEQSFGKTIHRSKTISERVIEGTPYNAATTEAIARCTADTFDEPIILSENVWRLPAGAYVKDGARP